MDEIAPLNQNTKIRKPKISMNEKRRSTKNKKQRRRRSKSMKFVLFVIQIVKKRFWTIFDSAITGKKQKSIKNNVFYRNQLFLKRKKERLKFLQDQKIRREQEEILEGILKRGGSRKFLSKTKCRI